jgi:hypothetical protein
VVAEVVEIIEQAEMVQQDKGIMVGDLLTLLVLIKIREEEAVALVQ